MLLNRQGARDGPTTKSCLAPNTDGAKVEYDVYLLTLILRSKFCGSVVPFFLFYPCNIVLPRGTD